MSIAPVAKREHRPAGLVRPLVGVVGVVVSGAPLFYALTEDTRQAIPEPISDRLTLSNMSTNVLLTSEKTCQP